MEIGTSSHKEEHAQLNQLLTKLLESFEALLKAFNHRESTEEIERETYQLLMNTKFELSQSKMEMFHAEVHSQLDSMYNKVTKFKENSINGV